MGTWEHGSHQILYISAHDFILLFPFASLATRVCSNRDKVVGAGCIPEEALDTEEPSEKEGRKTGTTHRYAFVSDSLS